LKTYTKFYASILGIFVITVGASVFWILTTQRTQFYEEVETEAKTLFDQIVLTRRWIADQGGVYVEKVEGVETNPYLLEMGFHDILDVEGNDYVLKNPALVTRELSEYAETMRGYRFHITSNHLVNPDNAPSDFEVESITQFEQGEATKTTRITTMDGERMYQYIEPLHIAEGCLSCHSTVDGHVYNVGDVRGAISVFVPLASTMQAIAESRNSLLISAVLFTIPVLFGLNFLVNRLLLGQTRTSETFHTLKDGLAKMYTPSATSMMLYRAGKEAGISAMEAEEDAGEGEALLRKIADANVAVGWASKISIGSFEPNVKIVVDVYDSIEAEGHQTQTPICDFTRGYWAGVCQTMTEDRVCEAKETHCLAKGDPYCRFEVNYFERAEEGPWDDA